MFLAIKHVQYHTEWLGNVTRRWIALRTAFNDPMIWG